MSVEAAGDGDARLTEGVRHLRFTKARGVVLEGQLLSRIVQAEAAQAVGICEFPKVAELVVA